MGQEGGTYILARIISCSPSHRRLAEVFSLSVFYSLLLFPLLFFFSGLNKIRDVHVLALLPGANHGVRGGGDPGKPVVATAGPEAIELASKW